MLDTPVLQRHKETKVHKGKRDNSYPPIAGCFLELCVCAGRGALNRGGGAKGYIPPPSDWFEWQGRSLAFPISPCVHWYTVVEELQRGQVRNDAPESRAPGL